MESMQNQIKCGHLRMARRLDVFMSEFDDGIRSSYRYVRPKLKFLTWFCILTPPLYYLYLQYMNTGVQDSLELRLFCATIAVPGLFYPHLERSRFGPVLPYYTVFVITTALPFFFTWALILNAILATSYESVVVWQMQYVFALVGTVLFLPDRVVLLCSLAAATGLAVAANYVDHASMSGEYFFEFCIEPIPFYIFMILAGMYFTRTREVIHEEKVQTAASLGSTFAHELRTPLLSIRSKAQGVQHFLPGLVQSYRDSQQKVIPEKKLGLLEDALVAIQNDVDYSNTIIDMLLVSSNTDEVPKLDVEVVSAEELVRDSIGRYPFANSGEMELVSVDVNDDFSVSVPRHLVIHVLLNLLKNALFHVQNGGGSGIRIVVDAPSRTIAVWDDGPGIAPEYMKRIFDRFFTTTSSVHGAGIGLSFSKWVMELIGGKIRCESVFGEYTRFDLSFPNVRRAVGNINVI